MLSRDQLKSPKRNETLHYQGSDDCHAIGGIYVVLLPVVFASGNLNVLNVLCTTHLDISWKIGPRTSYVFDAVLSN